MTTDQQIDSIKVMRLHPGDTVVLKVKQILSADQRLQLMACLSGLMPEAVTCLVMDGGMELEVLRKEDAAQPA